MTTIFHSDMKYIYLPIALVVLVVLLVVYFMACIMGGLFGVLSDFFEWVENAADRAIQQLEKWGDRL